VDKEQYTNQWERPIADENTPGEWQKVRPCREKNHLNGATQKKKEDVKGGEKKRGRKTSRKRGSSQR